ncbi:MAG: hypothetical protein EZS28_017753 [Streblomastix strix]|uniref:Uncharacterized protein n=1 Tax=Streblomastix strix TaxID=222440 RepID=A0A5J4VWS2_9EUKA|nr:MAG: hypothetical protein EZS28_017753 [Streblomastix strix]
MFRFKGQGDMIDKIINSRRKVSSKIVFQIRISKKINIIPDCQISRHHHRISQFTTAHAAFYLNLTNSLKETELLFLFLKEISRHVGSMSATSGTSKDNRTNSKSKLMQASKQHLLSPIPRKAMSNFELRARIMDQQPQKINPEHMETQDLNDKKNNLITQKQDSNRLSLADMSPSQLQSQLMNSRQLVNQGKQITSYQFKLINNISMDQINQLIYELESTHQSSIMLQGQKKLTSRSVDKHILTQIIELLSGSISYQQHPLNSNIKEYSNRGLADSLYPTNSKQTNRRKSLSADNPPISAISTVVACTYEDDIKIYNPGRKRGHLSHERQDEKVKEAPVSRKNDGCLIRGNRDKELFRWVLNQRGFTNTAIQNVINGWHEAWRRHRQRLWQFDEYWISQGKIREDLLNVEDPELVIANFISQLEAEDVTNANQAN